ncbi:hypothetical protein JTB14_002166 [Gonioctena quinquepunctata]|nr:hypothetical protein JTB14_002166 [Gonioctena quinquepunctata]
MLYTRDFITISTFNRKKRMIRIIHYYCCSRPNLVSLNDRTNEYHKTMESNKMVCYSEIKNTATLEPEIKITHDSKIEADYLLLKRNNTKPTEKKPGLRAVSKNGEYNIHHSKVSRKFLLRDIFVTLVDMKWRWTITIFSAGFFGSWTWFATDGG